MNAISGNVNGMNSAYQTQSSGRPEASKVSTADGGKKSGLAFPEDEVSISDRARQLLEEANEAKEKKAAQETSKKQDEKKSEQTEEREDEQGWAVTEITGDPGNPAGMTARRVAEGSGSIPGAHA